MFYCQNFKTNLCFDNESLYRFVLVYVAASGLLAFAYWRSAALQICITFTVFLFIYDEYMKQLSVALGYSYL